MKTRLLALIGRRRVRLAGFGFAPAAAQTAAPGTNRTRVHAASHAVGRSGSPRRLHQLERVRDAARTAEGIRGPPALRSHGRGTGASPATGNETGDRRTGKRRSPRARRVVAADPRPRQTKSAMADRRSARRTRSSLTPEAAQRLKGLRTRSSFVGGPFDGPEDLGMLERCISRSIPGSMIPVMYGNNYQIIQSPGYVVITYEIVHEARVIPLDGRPTWAGVRAHMGDPRGRWDGNTLVVETTNFTSAAAYRNANAETFRVIERFTRVAPDRIEWTATLDDPKTWTRPWTIAMPLTADPHPILAFECHEHNYGLRNILSAAERQNETSKLSRTADPGGAAIPSGGSCVFRSRRYSSGVSTSTRHPSSSTGTFRRSRSCARTTVFAPASIGARRSASSTARSKITGWPCRSPIAGRTIGARVAARPSRHGSRWTPPPSARRPA